MQLLGMPATIITIDQLQVLSAQSNDHCAIRTLSLHLTAIYPGEPGFTGAKDNVLLLWQSGNYLRIGSDL